MLSSSLSFSVLQIARTGDIGGGNGQRVKTNKERVITEGEEEQKDTNGVAVSLLLVVSLPSPQRLSRHKGGRWTGEMSKSGGCVVEENRRVLG